MWERDVCDFSLDSIARYVQKHQFAVSRHVVGRQVQDHHRVEGREKITTRWRLSRDNHHTALETCRQTRDDHDKLKVTRWSRLVERLGKEATKNDHIVTPEMSCMVTLIVRHFEVDEIIISWLSTRLSCSKAMLPTHFLCCREELSTYFLCSKEMLGKGTENWGQPPLSSHSLVQSPNVC